MSHTSAQKRPSEVYADFRRRGRFDAVRRELLAQYSADADNVATVKSAVHAITETIVGASPPDQLDRDAIISAVLDRVEADVVAKILKPQVRKLLEAKQDYVANEVAACLLDIEHAENTIRDSRDSKEDGDAKELKRRRQD
ncbi:hypothetical protein HDU82_007108 [Entophlyctis luteolus]|nr:hypothetical protein HDU82_007108 [Entophlyctis luteolus]